ncbi:MAG TPA: outer membrane lipoprotein-sorting protein, partial [Paracoccaceae bacterium]|nr:outer membrane lipoprotein-sorting protein [Paracoccaceae bacterium]
QVANPIMTILLSWILPLGLLLFLGNYILKSMDKRGGGGMMSFGVKRIVASNSSADSEPVSLFGSEFTTEDQETGKLDEYTFNLLDTVTYQGNKAYVIEQIPTPARARKSRYSRTVIWVDAERYVMLKGEMYDKRGKEIRRLFSDKFQQINGVWLARSLTIMNLVSNRLSNMAMLSIDFGMQIDDSLMTQRALTDTAFRERHLEALRAQAN